MKPISGLKLLSERVGQGRPAERGDRVIFTMKLYLNQGEKVALFQGPIDQLPAERLRHKNGETLIDHHSTLGKRQAIAGVEQTLIGMQVGGYRKARISPHLAYRAQGIPGLIPANAVLIAELWLHQIDPPQDKP